MDYSITKCAISASARRLGKDIDLLGGVSLFECIWSKEDGSPGTECEMEPINSSTPPQIQGSNMLGVNHIPQPPSAGATAFNFRKKCRKLILDNLLLVISVLSMLVGLTAGALLTRFYFVNGGSRKWLYAWIQTAGWPFSVVAVGIISWKKQLKLAHLGPKLGCAYLVLGGLLSIDSFMYVWGAAYISASTNALLGSCQLIFTAIFAYLLNRQKITAYGYNAVALVTTSAVILAVHSNSDTPPGVTRRQYIVAYIMAVSAAALYGFILPLTELVLTKSFGQASNFEVLQVQTYVAFAATAFSTLGMAVNHDFSALHQESHHFKGGQNVYYGTIFSTIVCFEVAFLGIMGTLGMSSSLLAGVVIAASLPIASTFAVAFFHDNFGALKVISLFLCLWGFTSYIYGGYLQGKKSPSEIHETEMA